MINFVAPQLLVAAYIVSVTTSERSIIRFSNSVGSLKLKTIGAGRGWVGGDYSRETLRIAFSRSECPTARRGWAPPGQSSRPSLRGLWRSWTQRPSGLQPSLCFGLSITNQRYTVPRAPGVLKHQDNIFFYCFCRPYWLSVSVCYCYEWFRDFVVCK